MFKNIWKKSNFTVHCVPTAASFHQYVHALCYSKDPKIIHKIMYNALIMIKEEHSTVTMVPLLCGHPWGIVNVAALEGWPLVRGRHDEIDRQIPYKFSTAFLI